MKYYLFLILFFAAFSASAQHNQREHFNYAPAFDDAVWNCDYQRDDNTETTISTDIFGNQIKTFKDANGLTFRSIKRAKDILGKLITTIYDGNGRTVLEVQCDTDILGKETVKIIGQDYRQLGYLSRYTDIMGTRTTTIRDDVHDTTTTITRSTDIFGNQQVKISGPPNNFDEMLAGFVAERLD